MDDHPDWEVSTRPDEPDTIRAYACTNYGDEPAYLSKGEAVEMANALLDAAGVRVADDIMRRIAHIIDHEAFDGDGTLGRQVAERITPTLADVWDHGWNNGADYMCDDSDALYIAGNPFNDYRTEHERRRAIYG